MQASSRWRFMAAALAAAFLITALPLHAGAAATSAAAGLPFGGFTSMNVEWVRNVPIEQDALYPQVAYRIGDHFYVDGFQRFSIFDVSDPLEPKLLSQIERPGPGPWPSSTGYFTDVGRSVTNGKIVVMPGGHPDYFTTTDPRALYVFDISDKTEPKKIAELPVDETFWGLFCLLDCTWLYDRNGHVVDLRDPRDPRLTYANWKAGLQFNNPAVRTGGPTDAAEVIEVAPGRLLTGSVPMYLLDARKDPRHPRVVARSDGTPLSYGDVAWPRFGSGGIALSSDPDTYLPMCDSAGTTRGTALDHGFATWDTSRSKTLGIMTRLDEWKPRNGVYADGDPPASEDDACGVNRFDVHPGFRGGGLVAAAALAHGLKILRVDEQGGIKLAGWFLPYGSARTMTAFFISDRIVYAIDHHRGIDLLRYEGNI